MIHKNRTGAGKLIEESGLKGKSFYNLRISDKHANFILNDNNADFTDLINLEHKIRSEVKKQFSIDLEREVIYISSTGKKN